MKTIAIAVLAMGLVVPAPRAEAQTLPASELAAAESLGAMGALDDGLFDVAISRATECLRLDPTSWGCFMTRGEALFSRIPDAVLRGESPIEENADWKRSVDDLSKAIAMAPQTAWASLYEKRGDVYGYGDTPESVMLGIKDVERSLQIEPDYAVAKELLADLRNVYGDRLITRGEAKFADALELDQAGKAVDASKLFDEALLDLTLALDFAGADLQFKGLFLRAQLYDELGQMQKALPDLDRALQLSPQQLGARLLRAMVEIDLNEEAAALADYDFVIAIPDRPALTSFKTQAYSDRALLHYERGRFAAAAADFEKYLVAEPADEDAAVFRAIAMHKSGSVAAAEAELRRLLAASKDPQSILAFLAVEGVRFGAGTTAPAATPTPTPAVPPAAAATTPVAPPAPPAASVGNPSANAGPVIFADEFNDNRNLWLVYDDTTHTTSIDPLGHYVMELKKPITVRYLLPAAKAPQIDQTKDFTIQTEVRYLYGSTNSSFGVVWGAKDPSNQFEFGLNEMGLFYYARVVNGTWQNIIPWTETNAMSKGAGTTNRLGVRKRGVNLELLVNDTVVGTYPFEPFMGQVIGFGLAQNKKIEANYLRVTQP